MGMSKRLLDEPEVCSECGADLEWQSGKRVCAADCRETQIQRFERLENARIRGEGWDAFHDGVARDAPPSSILSDEIEIWQRGWGIAERGKSRPLPR